ncbi:MAG: hypothetical protein FWD69_07715 [Polyangiaceae bacterium]|nr:hypothetical protein [Polyangiaceae bacterium]
MPQPKTRILLVEGKTEERIIPELMEANDIHWGPPKNPIVTILDSDGVENLLREIPVRLKTPGLTALGVIVDADDDADAQWQRIRARVLGEFAELPNMLPKEGLVVTSKDGKIRFGAWVMPDNQSRGMLETFLHFMRPKENQLLLDHTHSSTMTARELGATFKEAHLDKAEIHTWLAWQHPPGCQLHDAVKQKILVPKHPYAGPFVTWFKLLFGV